jgi:hypothetical protein
MSERDKIKILLKEAVLYQKQGLLDQSKEKYETALRTVKESQAFSKQAKLIHDIEAKIDAVGKTLQEIDEGDEAPQLSGDVQDLIKKSFSFSKDKEAAAIEGAMALAKFGQYDRAMEEFKAMLKDTTLPVMLAKNIFRCHLSLSSPEGAVEQFKEWMNGEIFSTEDLKHLRAFLVGVFNKREIQMDVPEAEEPETPGVIMPEEPEEGELDISSVGIEILEGPGKGKSFEFDVSLQSGNIVSIVVPANKKELLALFKHGVKFSGIQCYTPIGFFKADGTVSGKTKIIHGEDKGDFMIDLKMEGL